MSGSKPPNILLIMSDEHDPGVTACYGHTLVKTPALDRLAGEGVLFDNAYCNSPMCVPSRMSFIAGRYGSQIGVWDNGSPLSCEVPTFAHYLEAGGYETVLCGRMHMVGPDRLHGFGRRLYEDMESWKKFGQKPRRTREARRGSNSHVSECGPGVGSYQNYDETVTDLTVRYLQNKSKQPRERPWLLVSGTMFPHFPLIAPQKYYDLYPHDSVELQNRRVETLSDQHPVIQQLRYFFHNDRDLPEELERKALASYYALTTLTDANVGRMLEVIDGSPLEENTIVIYTSDHGEMGGGTTAFGRRSASTNPLFGCRSSCGDRVSGRLEESEPMSASSMLCPRSSK